MAIGYLQDEKKLNRRILHALQDGMKDNKKTHKDMSELLGLNSRQTFDYKLNNMTFSAYELVKMFRILKFEDDEILYLMKGD